MLSRLQTLSTINYFGHNLRDAETWNSEPQYSAYMNLLAFVVDQETWRFKRWRVRGRVVLVA